jgi:hypothetical protein
MMSIVLMLLLLIGSFLLFAGLVRFSEMVIRPAPAPPMNRLNTATDGPKRTGQA